MIISDIYNSLFMFQSITTEKNVSFFNIINVFFYYFLMLLTVNHDSDIYNSLFMIQSITAEQNVGIEGNILFHSEIHQSIDLTLTKP